MKTTAPVAQLDRASDFGFYARSNRGPRGQKSVDQKRCSADHGWTAGVRMSPEELEKFEERIVFEPMGGCWLWVGSTSPRGYGSFSLRGRWRRAHRVSYEHFVGPIPEGMVPDHLCRTPQCVNPEHIEPVTQRVNILRGINHVARQMKQTACIYGHPFDEANTRILKNGRRQCIECKRETGGQRRYKGPPIDLHAALTGGQP